MKESPQKKPPNKFLALTSAGIQMGLTIYLAVYAGKKLDQSYPNEKGWFTIAFTILGVFISIYLLIKQVNKINE